MNVRSFSLAKTPWRLPAVDRVWLAIAAILALTALADWQQAQDSLVFTFASLISVAPFLLASVAFTAGADASGADRLIARAFSGRVLTMIVLAALIGGLSPLCSCGVIPLIAALLAVGVPLAPVMAFWLSSPVIDPAMFLMTAGLLGPGFAIAKAIIAVGLGLAGGFAIVGLMRAGLFADPLRPGIGKGGCGAQNVLKPQPIAWRFWVEEGRRRTF
ncbi:MAG TPA: permease, partial [Afifellaceae bacterium]|nr:permease [Afifellaceae bacterium]